MADSTLDSLNFELIDTFPDGPEGLMETPTRDPDGNILTNGTFHNVAAPVYRVGQKVRITDPTTGLPAVFVYGQMGAAGGTIAAGTLLGEEITHADGVTNGKLTDLINATKGCIILGKAAMALSAMTDDYFGWFQVGGKPAYGLVAALSSTTLLKTDGTVAAGPFGLGADTAGTGTAALVLAATAIAIGIAHEADA